MKLVKWIDDKGYKHLSWIMNGDLDNEAPNGIRADPPLLGRIDWSEVEKEIHNLLVDRGLINWQEVQKQQNGVSNTIITVLKRRIIALYRSQEKE